jgi:hypothetical protein
VSCIGVGRGRHWRAKTKGRQVAHGAQGRGLIRTFRDRPEACDVAERSRGDALPWLGPLSLLQNIQWTMFPICSMLMGRHIMVRAVAEDRDGQRDEHPVRSGDDAA